MVREVIFLNVGECGLRMGCQTIKQYTAENNIGIDGKAINNNDDNKSNNNNNAHVSTFFEETSSGNYKSRSLFADLEIDIINEIKQYNYSSLFDSNNMIWSIEDAANNYARGYWSVGRELEGKTKEKIRKLVEKCDMIQGFILNKSINGGTGSGFGDRILHNIKTDYPKTVNITSSVFPSINVANNVQNRYNSMLSIWRMIEDADCGLVFNNEGLYNIYKYNAHNNGINNYNSLDFINLNSYIAKVISSSIMLSGFNKSPNLNAFSSQLVPLPRMPYVVSSISSICGNKIKVNDNYNVLNGLRDQIKNCFNYKNLSIGVDKSIKKDEDYYLSMNLIFRGNNIEKHNVIDSVQYLQSNPNDMNVKFVDWSPSGIKCGFNKQSIIGLHEDKPFFMNDNNLNAYDDEKVVMIGNTSAVTSLIHNITIGRDELYCTRAYVHWYVGEGMEEGEFGEARDVIFDMINDYTDICVPQTNK